MVNINCPKVTLNLAFLSIFFLTGCTAELLILHATLDYWSVAVLTLVHFICSHFSFGFRYDAFCIELNLQCFNA